MKPPFECQHTAHGTPPPAKGWPIETQAAVPSAARMALQTAHTLRTSVRLCPLQSHPQNTAHIQHMLLHTANAKYESSHGVKSRKQKEPPVSRATAYMALGRLQHTGRLQQGHLITCTCTFNTHTHTHIHTHNAVE